MRAPGNAIARREAELLENVAPDLEPRAVAARFSIRSGSEAAPNRGAASGERRAIARNGPAQSLAAIAGRDRGPVRIRGKEPDEEDNPGFRAATARAAAINRADARGTRGRQSRRGTTGADVPGDSGVVAFAGGHRSSRWDHHRNRRDE